MALRYVDIRVGKQYCVITSTNSGRDPLPNGQNITVTKKSSPYIYFENESGIQKWCEAKDLGPVIIGKDKLTADLTKLKAAVASIESKLAYLADTGTDEFDELEYQCYNALKIAENKDIPMMDRAKALRDLVVGKRNV